MEETLHFPCKVVKDIGSIMVDMMCSKDPLSAGNQIPKRNRRKEHDPLTYYPPSNSEALTVKEILNKISCIVACTEPRSVQAK